jgi:hypothetical protein
LTDQLIKITPKQLDRKTSLDRSGHNYRPLTAKTGVRVP